MKNSFREVAAAPILNPDAAPKPFDMTGAMLAMLGAMLYSMKAIFVKLAYLPVDGLAAGDLPPITLMALRLGFSLPFYIAILIFAWRKGPKMSGRDLGLTVLAGIMAYYVCTWLDFAGLQYITAQLERLLLFTYPALVVLFGALFFGGRLTLKGVAAIGLAYSGLAIVFAGGDITQSDNLWLGSALVLGAAVLFALFQLFAKGFIDRMGARRFTCIAFIGAATAIMTHFLVMAVQSGGVAQALDLPPRIYLIGAAIAVFSTVLPSFFINIAMGRIGAQRVAMLGMVGPLATIIAAIIILGEPFALWDGVGTAVTLAGIALYMRLDQAQKA